MRKVIRYKREEKQFKSKEEIQAYLDEIIKRNYEILYYKEFPGEKLVLNTVVILIKHEKIIPEPVIELL